MATTPVIRYDLDKTGLSPNNLIVDEPHVLQAGATRSLAPKYGAFFTESVIVKDADTGITLTRGVDYICVELLQEASIISAKEICYLILIKNVSVSSNVTVTYQVLGGLYTRSADAIGTYYEQITASGGSVNWGDVLNKPFVFPPTDHLHDAADLYGFEYLVDSLERIRQAILLGSVPAFDSMLQSSLATSAQTIAGTLATKSVTPEGLKDTLSGNANFQLNVNGGIVILDGDVEVGHGNEANANRATNLNLGFGAGSVDLGIYNTFIGNYAGSTNTTGTGGTAVGANAMKSNTSGIANTAMGRDSLTLNTTGSNNAAIGKSSLGANTTGSRNIAVGVSSLQNNTTADDNVGVGYRALNANTTGINNIAVGSDSLLLATASNNNIAIGFDSLKASTSGDNNTAVGANALLVSTSGADNVAIGKNALDDNTTGNNNIAIGKDARGSTTTASDEITLGNALHTVLRCAATSITSLSDERDKMNWSDLGDSVGFIKAVQAKRFVWNERSGGRIGIPDIGFSAQQLKAAQEQTGYSVPGLVYESNPDKLEASYGKLIPILLDAISQQQKQIEKMQAQINVLLYV